MPAAAPQDRSPKQLVRPPYGESDLVLILGDTTRSRLLRYLAEHPDQAIQQTEIADEIGVSQAMVSRVLSTFADAGIINRRSVGVKLADNETADQIKSMVDTFVGLEVPDDG